VGEIFLKIEEIKGESLDEHYEDAIDVNEWSWTASNTAAMEQSQAAGSTKLDAHDIEVTKIIDKATVTLMQFCALGTPIANATLVCRKKEGDTKLEYLTIKLMDVKIKKLVWKGTDELARDGLPSNEIVTLNFAKFQMTYHQQMNPSHLGNVPGPVTFGFNIAHNKPL
jgi:type VI secretion system secreted protein Hcp